MNPQFNEGTAAPSPSNRADECPPFPESAGPLRIAILALIALTTLLVSALVWTQAWHIGIAREWQWPYFPRPESCAAAAPALFLCALMAAVVAVFLRRGLSERRNEIIAAGLCAALSLGIILETAQAVPTAPYDAYNSIVAPWAGGYYAEAVHVSDMGAYLKDYAADDPAVAGGRPHPRPYRGSSRRACGFSLGGEPRSRSLARGGALVHAGRRRRSHRLRTPKAGRSHTAGPPMNSRDRIFQTANSPASGPRPFCSDWATGSR